MLMPGVEHGKSNSDLCLENMKSIRRNLLILLTVLTLSAPVRSWAVDPATMTAAAPRALELATLWSPHAINAMQSAGVGFVDIGVSTINILRLPLGLVQCTLGYPFGFGEAGMENCVRGATAPFELVFHVLLLPVRIISLGAVR